MRPRATCALLGVLFLAVFDTSTECFRTTARPDKGSAVMVSAGPSSDRCAVCTVGGANDSQVSCHSSLSLVPEEEVKLLFNCTQPLERSYEVTVARTIECTADQCNPAMIETQSSILPEFSRTFTWEVKAPAKTAVTLDVLGEGLVESSQPCPNGFQFTVAASKTNTKDQTRYCRGGSVTHLAVADQGVVSLQVQPKAPVDAVFKASAGPLRGGRMVLTLDSSTTVDVSRDPAEPECEVCSVDGSVSNCSPTRKTLTNVVKAVLEFGCQKPEDTYAVSIRRKIGCTTSSCSPAVGEADPSLFKGFKRSLKWDISVPDRTVLTLDFPGGGLKEISGAGDCPDGYQYLVSNTKSDGSLTAKRYCRGGTVSQLNLQGATTVQAEVPKGGDPDQTAFSVQAAPRGSRIMLVTPEPKTTIHITRTIKDPDCSVCVSTPKQTCSPTRVKITDPGKTSVEFTCPQPQFIYSVEINRQIDCTAITCSGDIVQAASLLFPDFNRTFTWDLKVSSTMTFRLDFPETGIRQILKESTCPNDHTYSLVIYTHAGPATIGTFCKGGPITTILAPYKGRVTLQVPANTTLDPVDFKLNVGPETNMLAIVNVNLPRGVSNSDFFTPNYPSGFPDAQQVQWNFTVPGMHNYTMQFLKQTSPECISNDVEVWYQREDGRPAKLALTDPQPKHQQGNFNMVLKNCETNTTLQGLSLSYRVSVMRSGHPVLCTVDLTKQQGLSLQIEKTTSDPYCEISIDSTVTEKINVAAGTKAGLSFLDCPKEDLRLTASEALGCQDAASCPTSFLTVPKLDSCLPMPLYNFTWHISVPEDSTVELASPTGSLRQSLPGQECSQTVLLNLADEDGASIGDFCYDGIIQKLQVHTNMSVTATTADFSRSSGPFLNVSFSPEFSDTIIYRISPKISSPTLLATPNWPQGMTPFSSVSWVVDLPAQYKADIQFINMSQPKCLDGHTSILVKMLGHEEEILSLREDSQLSRNLSVPKSFYLNVSNCLPEVGRFGVATRIVLQQTSNILPIILGIVGGVLLLLLVLVVICVIKKKKKGKMTRDSSIYMGKGNIFRPGDNHFTKSRSENNSHIYNTIEDNMVYTTCPNNVPDHFKGAQVDSYQTFTGPTDRPLPEIKEPDPEPEMDQFDGSFMEASQTFIPSRPRTPIGRQDSYGFQDRRMMDNTLYTFKSTGEINTIQLIGVNNEPRKWVSEESL